MKTPYKILYILIILLPLGLFLIDLLTGFSVLDPFFMYVRGITYTIILYLSSLPHLISPNTDTDLLLTRIILIGLLIIPTIIFIKKGWHIPSLTILFFAVLATYASWSIYHIEKSNKPILIEVANAIDEYQETENEIIRSTEDFSKLIPEYLSERPNFVNGNLYISYYNGNDETLVCHNLDRYFWSDYFCYSMQNENFRKLD